MNTTISNNQTAPTCHRVDCPISLFEHAVGHGECPGRERSADIPARPWMTFADDQGDVPPEIRAEDLLRLASAIAEVTDPLVQAALQEQDRLLLAMAVPNLPDAAARRRLLDIVAELHQAELAAGDVDHRDPDYREAADYRDSAATLARELVAADLAAVVALPGLRLITARNVPMAGAR